MENIPRLDSEKRVVVVKKKKTSNIVIVLLVALVVILIGVLVWQQEWFEDWIGGGKKAKTMSTLPIKRLAEISEYSAVFLTNNQVYFGKLSDEKSQYPVLKDVYYLRAQKSIQPPIEIEDEDDKKKTVRTAKPALEQEMKLIKLGNELHGPEDEIKLNRDHILFIESLKSNSRVVEAIEKYQLQLGVNE